MASGLISRWCHGRAVTKRQKMRLELGLGLMPGRLGRRPGASAASERDERRPRADVGWDRQRRRCRSSGAALRWRRWRDLVGSGRIWQGWIHFRRIWRGGGRIRRDCGPAAPWRSLSSKRREVKGDREEGGEGRGARRRSGRRSGGEGRRQRGVAEVWVAGDAACGREGSDGRRELRAALRFGSGPSGFTGLFL